MTLGSWARTPGWEPAARWHLSRPFRALAGFRALPHGRALCSRLALGIAWRTVQPGSVLLAHIPGGGSVELGADTMIGRTFWTTGSFERSELLAAFRLSAAGTHAFDVGANVGLFTVAMSRAVGPMGRVIAVEPHADTVRQLRGNLARNQCVNVDVVEGAAAASSGEVPLLLTDDPALHSAGGRLMSGHPAIRTITVKAQTLDEVWRRAGQPQVSLIKIDVEGWEDGVQQVRRTAAEMIGACRPAVIIEVNDPGNVRRVAELLSGYHTVRVRGFEPWNYLMAPV